MVQVYAWPPVVASGAYFTTEHPTSASRGMAGQDVVSAAWRERKLARVNVSGVLNGGGGYIEALKRLLQGGVNLVRLTTLPSHYARDWLDNRGQFAMAWTAGLYGLDWIDGGDDLVWLTGATLTAVLVSDPPFQAIDVSGFEPGAVACFPNEAISVGGVATWTLTHSVANASGVARIRVMDALTAGGAVQIGTIDTAAYRVEGGIESFQTAGQAFSYDISFRQVFEDETDGFTEVNPWRLHAAGS